MTRDEYLAQLRALLTGRTPPDELERIVAYYTEYFDEAGPAGEARVVQELGTPAELVGRILGANRVRETPAERTPPTRGSGHSSLWKRRPFRSVDLWQSPLFPSRNLQKRPFL